MKRLPVSLLQIFFLVVFVSIAGFGCQGHYFHYVNFTSEPSGADVTFDGDYIGRTPFRARIGTTDLDLTSTHVFTATKQGYRQDIQTYYERSLEGFNCVPDAIHFKLEKEGNK